MATIAIYTGNHRSCIGIEDYILSLKEIYAEHSVIVTPFVPCSHPITHCIIIENFTDMHWKAYLSLLQELKRNNIKTILVHTEFLCKDLTINIFESHDKLVHKLIPSHLHKAISQYYYRASCSQFKPKRIVISAVLFLASILFADPSRRRANRLLYHVARSYSLQRLLPYFDFHIALSFQVYQYAKRNLPNIEVSHLNPIVPQPIQHYYTPNSRLRYFFIFTGNFTPWRKAQLSSIQSHFPNAFSFQSHLPNASLLPELITNLHHDTFVLYLSPSDFETFNEYRSNLPDDVHLITFELYIPQTVKWPHLSEMRIFRSLRQNLYPVSFGDLTYSPMNMLHLNFKDPSLIGAGSLGRELSEWLNDYHKNVMLYNNESKVKNSRILTAMGL